MAKWTVGKGIDKYIQDLQNLEFGSEEMAKRAVYEGAKIVTDAIRTSIQALPVGPPREGKVTQAQKAGLLEGLGIAGFRKDGTFINVKVGMDGYNSVKSKKFPNGQPNALIARSLESGSSFAPKRPFIGPSVNRTKGAAERAIAEKLDDEIKKVMK